MHYKPVKFGLKMFYKTLFVGKKCEWKVENTQGEYSFHISDQITWSYIGLLSKDLYIDTCSHRKAKDMSVLLTAPAPFVLQSTIKDSIKVPTSFVILFKNQRTGS